MTSLTQVLIDVIPGYRIKLPTKQQLAQEQKLGHRISRDVQKNRAFEKSLVTTYGKLVSLLRVRTRRAMTGVHARSLERQRATALAKGKSTAHIKDDGDLSLTALRCMCLLFERGFAFNFAKHLASFLAAVLTSSLDTYRDLVARSVVFVFKSDVAGDATLEIVRAISAVFKARGADRIRAPLLSVLLSLPLDKNVITARILSRNDKKKNQQLRSFDGKRAPVGKGVHNWARDQEKLDALETKAKKMLRAGKEVDFKKMKAQAGIRDASDGPAKVDVKALRRDMEEADAEVSLTHRRKTQTAILALVMTIYFRYLKQAPTLKSLYSKNTAAANAAAAAASEEAKKKENKDENGNKDGTKTTDASGAPVASAAPATYVDKDGVTRMVPWKPPAVTEPPSHLLLAAVLKGVCQFAYLVNVELVLDLLEHLKIVIGASAVASSFSPSMGATAEEGANALAALVPRSLKERRRMKKEQKQAAARETKTLKLLSGKKTSKDEDEDDEKEKNGEDDDDEDGDDEDQYALPLRSALLCIHTTFTLLKMHSSALTIDLHAFYASFYDTLWQLIFPHESHHLPLALDCWELMLCTVRVPLPPARVAALCRRFMIVASQLNPALSIAVTHAVGLALQRHPRAGAILHNEGHNSGQYDPLIGDPDVSHALATPAWDIALWAGSSFHPLMPRFITHALDVPAHMYAVAAATGTNAEQFGNPASVSGPVVRTGPREKRGHASLELSDDGMPAFATSGLTVTVGGDRCPLSRLAPRHVLRLLDRSAGALFPDIPAPTPVMLALSAPDHPSVTPSALKTAMSRASTARRAALLTRFAPARLVPAAYAAAVDRLEEAGGVKTFPKGFSVENLFRDPFAVSNSNSNNKKGNKQQQQQQQKSAKNAKNAGTEAPVEHQSKKARRASALAAAASAAAANDVVLGGDSVAAWVSTPLRWGGPAGVAAARDRKRRLDNAEFAVLAGRVRDARGLTGKPLTATATTNANAVAKDNGAKSGANAMTDGTADDVYFGDSDGELDFEGDEGDEGEEFEFELNEDDEDAEAEDEDEDDDEDDDEAEARAQAEAAAAAAAAAKAKDKKTTAGKR